MTDPTGAAVASATVILRSPTNGIETKTTSNSSGFYEFDSLPPGRYKIVASSAGFSEVAIDAEVSTSETRGVDVKLQVAGSGSSVTVTGETPLLNLEESRVQQTLSADEISQLPLPNRDVQLLIALTPGVVGHQNQSPSNGYGNTLFAGNFKPPYSANGQGTNANLYLIDDLPVNDAQEQGAALILPNADMIDQVALQTQTYSVENSTGGSIQTSYTSKSGSNAFHGSADVSYDSSNIGAAHQPNFNPDPTFKNPITPFNQTIYLASLGGPIIKDHTFFFGSIEKQVSKIAATSLTNPYFTPAFAKWAAATFPDSGAAQALVFAPPSRDFGGTVETAAQLYGEGSGTPCGQTNYVTVPNTDPAQKIPYNLPCDTAVYVKNSTFQQSQPFDGLQWNIRLDHRFRGGKDSIYGMYERIDQKLGNLAERPNLDVITPSQNKYFSVNYVHVFSPRLLNEAHFGNLRVINGNSLTDPRSASVPYLPILLDTAAGFQFTFPLGTTPFGAQTNKEHTYAFRDTVRYTIGNHNVRVGYQYFRGDVFQDSSKIYTRPFVPFYATDTFSWVSNTAQASYQLFTIGGDGTYKPQLYGASSTYNGVYVEDAWKVRPNLSITAGIRYDAFGNPGPYGSTAQPFVPLFPGSGATFQEQALNTTTRITKQAFTEAQNLNILPRVGFAYSPGQLKSTLLRGGIGLYENVLTPFQVAGNLPTQPPNRVSLNPFGVVPYGDFKTVEPPYGYNYHFPTYGVAPWGNVYSNADHTAVYSSNISGTVPKIKPEKFINYSLGLEQQLPANIVLGITYAGSHGYDLVYGSAGTGGGNADYNLKPNSPTARPTDHWGRINYGRNGLESNYNGLIATVRQKFRNLNYQANYNWQRSLQDAPTVDSYSIWKGIYDPKSFYGPSSFDVTNSFSFAGTYEVPKFLNGRVANEVSAGWRLSALAIAQSGTPFTVYDKGKDYQNDGSSAFDTNDNGTPGFPNYSGTKRNFSRSEARSGAFLLSQFSDPAGIGTQPVTSNQGANTFRNLGVFTVNAGVGKAFDFPIPKISDHVSFAFRAEFINLLNRTNYHAFDYALTAGKPDSFFGQVTSADQKRFLQIGGRLQF